MNTSAPLSAAPLTGHPFGDRFAARLMDFSVRDMPWNRHLWSPGTVLTLRELLEAGPWVDAQVLSPAALQWLCGDLERLAGDDAGIGGQEVRRHLRDTLHADLSEHSRHRRRLRDLISLVEESYLTRWAAALDPGRGVSAERLARAVAAHLLDGGYSMSFVYQVLRQHVTAGATGSTESVALDAALRTAAPLVGAGLDRVVHAYLADGITPLALAATAETSLALAGAPDGLPVTDLLERNVTRAAA